MSGGGGGVKVPKQEQVEEVQRIEEDVDKSRKRERRKSLLRTGKQSTILAGGFQQLKQRLGE